MKVYKLNRSLFAHTSDVKCLHETRANGFVSVSRDLSAKIWQVNNNEYTETNCIRAHKKFVNSLTVVYTVDGFPNGLVITGSNDQTICIFDIESNSIILQLSEHTGAVCTLNCSSNNYLYSGSFDHTMKIWNLNDLATASVTLKSLFTIKGHSHTVWSVLPVPNTNFCLTGSADKLIKQWNLDQPMQTYQGHTDCVRGLALNPSNPNYFFSCSNDGTVIQWQFNSTSPLLRRFNITSSFLYSICVLIQPTREQGECYFATCGEDRSLRINHSAKGDSPIQTLVLPCQSLWNCMCLSNTDILIACNDGTIRIFTTDDARMASKAECDEYERELSKFAIPANVDENMAKINRNDLPGLEALTASGKTDGQLIMINNENEAEVYSWNQSESRWLKIGVAVGSATSAGGSATNRKRTVHEDKEYDFVFDIQLDDEGQTLKLPYNLSEDPWFAAQKFIHKHELNQIFLDQIAQFIINNTKGEIITAQSSTYVDPFTGASKYTPGNNGEPSTGGSTNYDPFTGESRYMPPMNPSPNTRPQARVVADPFTGDNAYHTNGGGPSIPDVSAKSTPAINPYYPQAGFVLFDQKNIPSILNKIKEFQQVNKTTETTSQLIEKLANMDTIDLNQKIETLFHLINSWTTETIFPVLDLTRILVSTKEIQAYFCTNKYENVLYESLELQINGNAMVNSMLIARIFVNLFSSYDHGCLELTMLLLDKFNDLILKLNGFIRTNNKAFQLSYTTLLLDYAVLFNKDANHMGVKTSALDKFKLELLHYICGELESFLKWDLEAQFRLLVCIGTLICADSYLTTMARTIVDLKQYLINLKSLSNLNKVSECVDCLLNFLY